MNSMPPHGTPSAYTSTHEGDDLTSPSSRHPISHCSPLDTQTSARPAGLLSSLGSTASVSDTVSSVKYYGLPCKYKNRWIVVVNINGVRGQMICVKNRIAYTRAEIIIHKWDQSPERERYNWGQPIDSRGTVCTADNGPAVTAVAWYCYSSQPVL